MRDLKKKRAFGERFFSDIKYVKKLYESKNLVLLALLIFACGAMFLEWTLGSHYVAGQPSPRHYIALNELQYTDNDAMARLRELADQRVIAVVVKDGEAKQDFRVSLQMLRSVSNTTLNVPNNDFPRELLAALRRIPEQERNEVLSHVEKIGALLSQPTSEDITGTHGARAWSEIDKLELTPETANLVYQILDTLLGSAFKVDEHLTGDVKQQLAEKIPSIERRIEPGDILVERGQIITPELARLLRSQGYVGQEFPAESLLFSCALIILLPFWFKIPLENSPQSRRQPPWLFISIIMGSSWFVEVLGNYIGIVGLGCWALVACSFTVLPPHLALYVSLGGNLISTFLMVGISYNLMGLLLFLGIITSVIGYFVFIEMISRRKIMQNVVIFGIFFVSVEALVRLVVGLNHDWFSAAVLFVLGVVISFIFLFSLPFLENVMGILTPMRLREICHPSVPLLKKLQIEVPGTYQHALTLGSLAENVAEELALDGNLMKAGAYYHDIGKLRRPLYYVENQMGVGNIQDNLSPPLSAVTIIAHVKEGLELAEEYGLPVEVRDFIAEHHGTTFLSYFYKKAVAEGLNVSEEQFCYPGPKPRSRETALLMLLDSMEAAVRANSQNISTLVDIEKVLNRVIEMKLSEKQLDDVEFTFKDIAKIKSVMLKAFQSMYHTRKIKELSERAIPTTKQSETPVQAKQEQQA